MKEQTKETKQVKKTTATKKTTAAKKTVETKKTTAAKKTAEQKTVVAKDKNDLTKLIKAAIKKICKKPIGSVLLLCLKCQGQRILMPSQIMSLHKIAKVLCRLLKMHDKTLVNQLCL